MSLLLEALKKAALEKSHGKQAAVDMTSTTNKSLATPPPVNAPVPPVSARPPVDVQPETNDKRTAAANSPQENLDPASEPDAVSAPATDISRDASSATVVDIPDTAVDAFAGSLDYILDDDSHFHEGIEGVQKAEDNAEPSFGEWSIDEIGIDITETGEDGLDVAESIKAHSEAGPSKQSVWHDRAFPEKPDTVRSAPLEPAEEQTTANWQIQADDEHVDARTLEIEQSRSAQQALRQNEGKRAKEKAALQQLLTSDKAIMRKARHQTRFLYAMLFVSALGGTLSYYFYLLLNHDVKQLNDVQFPTATTESTVVFRDVFDLETGAVQNNENSPVLADSLPTALPKQTIPASEPVYGSQQAASAGSVSINRVDPAPSSSQYLNRFTNLTPLKSSMPASVGRTPAPFLVHHQTAMAAVSELVQQGFSAYRLGHYDESRIAYDRALNNAPSDRNALLGAAAVATQQGRFPQAMRYYQAVLSDAPGDLEARAAILSTTEKAQGGETVTAEIISLLQENPESAYLHFLNGVQLAARQRWSEAQQAFFAALYRDAENADYMYNLAVSLDHLKQPTQARRYYQQALDRSQSQAVRFSPAALSKRLAALAESPQ